MKGIHWLLVFAVLALAMSPVVAMAERAVVVGFALCGAALSTAAENGAKAVARAPVVPLDREAMMKVTVAKEFTAKDGFKLGYRLHLPAETKERPMIVMMHGLGEIGNERA